MNFPEELRAGDLRSRGVLRRSKGIRGAHGGVDPYDDEVATVSIAVEDLQGRELFDAQRRFAEVTTRIRMRYPRKFTVTPEMRLQVGETVYDIRAAVDINNRHRVLHLMCRALS